VVGLDGATKPLRAPRDARLPGSSEPDRDVVGARIAHSEIARLGSAAVPNLAEELDGRAPLVRSAPAHERNAVRWTCIRFASPTVGRRRIRHIAVQIMHIA
jgi:hypothetical protein